MLILVRVKTRFSSASPDRSSLTATEDSSPTATSKYTRSRAVQAHTPGMQERPDLIATQPGGIRVLIERRASANRTKIYPHTNLRLHCEPRQFPRPALPQRCETQP